MKLVDPDWVRDASQLLIRSACLNGKLLRAWTKGLGEEPYDPDDQQYWAGVDEVFILAQEVLDEYKPNR